MEVLNEFCTLDLTEQELEKDKATDMCRAEGDEGSQQMGRSNQSLLSGVALFSRADCAESRNGCKSCRESD